MKRTSEEAIDRVIAGLRNTKASAGIEHRLLEAVERRTAQRPASAWSFGLRGASWLYSLTHTRSYGLRPLAWMLALGGIVAMVSFRVTSRGTMYVTKHEIRHETVQPRSRIAPRPGTQAELHALASRRSLPSGPAARSHTASTAQIAASHAPPVPPLTREEKLLLRIAHTGDPREMAILNPEMRSQEAAASEAQFKRFVEQSAQGDQP